MANSGLSTVSGLELSRVRNHTYSAAPIDRFCLFASPDFSEPVTAGMSTLNFTRSFQRPKSSLCWDPSLLSLLFFRCSSKCPILLLLTLIDFKNRVLDQDHFHEMKAPLPLNPINKSLNSRQPTDRQTKEPTDKPVSLENKKVFC